MLVSEFDYHLPKSAIAQRPLKNRDQSRLLLVERKTGKLTDKKFREISRILRCGDILVVNNSRVIPARILARRNTGARIEITLIGKSQEGVWQGLVKGKKPKPGERVELGEGAFLSFIKELDLSPEAKWSGGLWELSFNRDCLDVLEKLGVAPLPPYIKRFSAEEYAEDRNRYQTIFAKEPGAVAAPTAGLHFTQRVLEDLKEKGIEIAEITLEVGYGTFSPVRVERIEDHRMYKERYYVPADSAQRINEARRRGGRVVAVGTTVVRTLEVVSNESGEIRAGEGETDLFIYPGYKFKAIDALLTNFHLPRSTLLMLVSAFVGLDLIKKAYGYALTNGYRFLSYGDCMLII